MARFLFGGTAADVAEDSSGARIPGATGTVWTGTGDTATQVTDLLDLSGNAIEVLTADDEGVVPAFYGPESGPERLYADFGSTRVALVATDVGDRLRDHQNAFDPHGDRAAITNLMGAPSGLATLGTDGKVTQEQTRLAGTWLPDDYGLRSWAYDLSTTSRTPGDRPSEAGRLYLVGVPLRVSTTVSKVACHVMTFDKPNSTVTSAYMGVYDSSLQRVAVTPNLSALFPDTRNVGGQMATFNLTSPVNLTAGSYYVAILVKGSGTTVPYLAATNWGSTATVSGAKAADVNGVHRWLQTTSTILTTLPVSLLMSDMADGNTCYWAGLG